ncbi:MAG: hypothetical protein ISS36_01040 [Candidatus Aenigmarchaeota archaeon]|nr:hypothetical protein [Candidatus Aenigmarchaeota archaeon]
MKGGVNERQYTKGFYSEQNLTFGIYNKKCSEDFPFRKQEMSTPVIIIAAVVLWLILTGIRELVSPSSREKKPKDTGGCQ